MKALLFGCMILATTVSTFAQTTSSVKLADMACKTKVISAQGSKIQIGMNFSNQVESTIIFGRETNIYQALLDDKASVTTKGKANVTFVVDKNTSVTNENVSSKVYILNRTNMDAQQFVKAGLSQADLQSAVYVRAYNLSSTDLPFGEIIAMNGKILLRYVTIKNTGTSQYVYACK